MLENAPTGRLSIGQRLAMNRSRITNKPIARWKGNTSEGRRVRDLYRALMHKLGNPADMIMQARVMHAAELYVAVEAQRLRAVRGEDVNLDALVRLSNAADRAVRRLGLRAAPSGPSFTDEVLR